MAARTKEGAITELGHFCLALALAVALVQGIWPLRAAARGEARGMALAGNAALAQFLLLAIAFAALVRAFVTSDFSVALVAAHSHSQKPLIYKIAGTWGNHEGSMLLWALILAFYGALIALAGGGLPSALRARVLAIQGLIGTMFLAFILFTSNPFLRLASPPADGADLNPLLQDPGLAIHPPMLYLGYVGLSVAYSFALAALIGGRVDAAWARWVRPWTLAAWLALTLGITLGSWWAYYELGWGGFWFWDPVENASLMPWLLATALLHSAIVAEKRDTLKRWVVLLAILAFSMSLLGTFLVRSGVITSVHAFASDPGRGLFILAILGLTTGGGLTLYALRAGSLASGSAFAPVSRESGLILNNLLLAGAAAIVLTGTLWPLGAEILSGAKISVGPPYFNAATAPFAALLALILPPAAMLPWKRGRLGPILRPLTGAAALALALLLWALTGGGIGLVRAAALALGAWVIAGALRDFARAQGDRLPRLVRARGSDWGKLCGHAGFGLVILAVTGLASWSREAVAELKPGETMDLGPYTLRLDAVEDGQGPNYAFRRAIVLVTRGGARVAVMSPERRAYPVAAMTTTEAAIRSRPAGDLYLALGEGGAGGGLVIRAWLKPLALWLWAGGGLMALGAALSLADRRIRLGAGLRPAKVPAE